MFVDVGIWKTARSNTCFNAYEGVSKSFRTESVTRYMLTFGITRCEATQRVMAAKLTTLAHKIAIKLHLVAESCTICSSRSRRPVRKLLDIPSYISCSEKSMLLNLQTEFTIVRTDTMNKKLSDIS
jgi:hypothetical protein